MAKKQSMTTLEIIYGNRVKPSYQISRPDCDDLGRCVTKHEMILVGKLGDLAKLGSKLEILNLYQKDMVIRKISFDGAGNVIMEAGDGSWAFSISPKKEVYYEPWFMDRGNYVLWSKDKKQFVKIATEYDPVRIVEP